MALGKGLKALIQEEPTSLVREENGKMILSVSVDRLMPNENQPRVHFDPDALQELASSIRQHGVLSPLIVRKEKEGYLIIAGERRWRASRMAGLDEVPVIVENLPDEQILEIALIENIQREDLNIMEEARAYQNLIDHFGYTQSQLAEKIGKSRSNVANVLRLNALPERVCQLTRENRLSYGHARCLLGLEDEADQIRLAEEACDGRLSVRQLEQKVAALKKGKPQEKEPEEPDQYVQDVQDQLSSFFDLSVSLKHKKDKGKIEIPYSSLDELDQILTRIGIRQQEEE